MTFCTIIVLVCPALGCCSGVFFVGGDQMGEACGSVQVGSAGEAKQKVPIKWGKKGW
jgi:cyanophycinase-like exopeptidase